VVSRWGARRAKDSPADDPGGDPPTRPAALVVRRARVLAEALLIEPRRSGPSLVAGFCLGAAAVVLFAMLQPVLGAQFGMIDDHKAIAAMPTHQALSVVNVPHVVVDETTEPIGRFRPVYWLGQSLEMATAGHNATWWYVDRVVLALVVLVSVFVVASKIIAPLPAAAVALLPFGGPQIETWLRLGPNEAYAMPLAAAGLAVVAVRAISGRCRPVDGIPGYALLFLAALGKENFIPLLPAAMVVSVAVTGLRRLLRADWITILAFAALTLLDLAAIARKVATFGTIYPQERTAKAVILQLRLVLETQNQHVWVSLAVLVTLALVLRDRVKLWRAASIGLAVGFLLVLPQAFFMAGTGAEGRYLYPVALVACFAWTLAFWTAGTLRRVPMVLICVLLAAVAVPMRDNVALARDQAKQNNAQTRAFQDQLSDIAHAARASGTRNIVLEPYHASQDFEPVVSLSTYLTKQYGLTVMTVPAPATDSEFSQTLNALLRQWSLEGHAQFSPYERGVPCLSVLFGPTDPSCGAKWRLT
jgi:hypothetical protein